MCSNLLKGIHILEEKVFKSKNNAIMTEFRIGKDVLEPGIFQVLIKWKLILILILSSSF